MNQEIVILSYLPNYSTGGCRRGCCPSTKIDSDFDCHLAENEADAATYIAKRIQEHPEEDWYHVLLDDWSSVANLGRSFYLGTTRGADSIQIPYSDDTDELSQEKEDRRDRIRSLVEAKLAESKAAAEESAKREAQAQREAQETSARQRELAEYQRLQKKFG